jgi:hypothetical protein
VVANRDWQIPKGTAMFKFQQGQNQVSFPFPITLEYGSAGFRNAPGEIAFARNFLIEKI